MIRKFTVSYTTLFTFSGLDEAYTAVFANFHSTSISSTRFWTPFEEIENIMLYNEML